MVRDKFTFIQKLRNKIKINGSSNKIEINDNVKFVKNKVIIKGDNNLLQINKGVNIRGAFLQIVGNNCKLIISENTIIGENCYLSAKEENTTLLIGRDCMLSRNAKIMTSDGHPIFDCNKSRINLARDIHIGSKVWIADSATILKGVSVGNNCVIGINTVLTKSISDRCIATGNPAKVVKENITWKN